MGQWEVDQYIKKWEQHSAAEDDAVRREIIKEIEKIWYHYLTPAEQELIKEQSLPKT